MNLAYVYLLCDPSQNLYKIGVTRNIYTKRIKQLQTGNGNEIHLVSYYETFYPFRIEKFLHNKFLSKKTHGEWFDLNLDDISHFTENCKYFEYIINSLKDNPFFIKNLR